MNAHINSIKSTIKRNYWGKVIIFNAIWKKACRILLGRPTEEDLRHISYNLLKQAANRTFPCFGLLARPHKHRSRKIKTLELYSIPSAGVHRQTGDQVFEINRLCDLMSHRTSWETPRGRYDEYNSKSSPSYDTKV
jgi:hypothetical protein